MVQEEFMDRARKLPPLALLLFVAPLGCAFTNETVKPPQVEDVITRAQRGGGRTVVVAESFVDRRPDRARCGMKKNGYNVDSAKLLCAGSPDEFLPQLLAYELRAVGFRVFMSSGAKVPAADAVISGSVQQYFIEPKLEFFGSAMEADVGLNLTVRLADGRVAERRFYAKGEEATLFNMLEDAQTAASAATRELLASAAGAVANLLDAPTVVR
jgi:hypothetical protein